MQAIIAQFNIPIEAAVIVFPVIAYLLTLPYTVYNYMRYGSVSKWRTFIIFTMLFYLMCAYFLVILPLPNPAEVAQYTTPTTQLTPFRFVYDFIADSGFEAAHPATWLPALRSSAFYQPLFNFVLVLPWGVYLKYYFKARLRTTVILSFALSLFFELTQLSALYGLYPRSYRLFDVDDLILNTLGGVVGYAVALRLPRFLPSRDRIDKVALEKAGRVGYMRRLVAFAIDYVLINAVATPLASLLHLDALLSFTIVLFAYSILVPLIFRGATLGKLLTRQRIRHDSGSRATLLALLLRYLIRNLGLVSFVLASSLVSDVNFDYQAIPVLYELLCLIALVVDLLTSRRHNKRLLFERLSHTRSVSTFKPT
ncbi:MAG: VanZ family protein [Coriobacteriales bacterium]|jgi:glycopeptide antibiotics resistance protein|nr:VanZ family protein [Coriobacteriales bacterium]